MDLSQREAQLISEISEALPEFVAACKRRRSGFRLAPSGRLRRRLSGQRVLLTREGDQVRWHIGQRSTDNGKEPNHAWRVHCQAFIADSFHSRPPFSLPPGCGRSLEKIGYRCTSHVRFRLQGTAAKSKVPDKRAPSTSQVCLGFEGIGEVQGFARCRFLDGAPGAIVGIPAILALAGSDCKSLHDCPTGGLVFPRNSR